MIPCNARRRGRSVAELTPLDHGATVPPQAAETGEPMRHFLTTTPALVALAVIAFLILPFIGAIVDALP